MASAGDIWSWGKVLVVIVDGKASGCYIVNAVTGQGCVMPP